MLDPRIFRAYDIRGVVDQNLNPQVVHSIGRSFAAEALAIGQDRVLTGRDGRISGPALHEALNRGLAESGIQVIDIGLVPTPVLYFAALARGATAGVMVTGSHNPAEYNGLKMVLDGKSLKEADILNLHKRIERHDFIDGQGTIVKEDAIASYLDQVVKDIGLQRPLKVVVDCGNGAAGEVAPKVFRMLGCEVVELFCDIDGTFPNHHPDPANPQNLQDLAEKIRATGADCGLAFDGDGDRIGLVTDAGGVISSDQLLMLFAQQVIGLNPGTEVIFDVKCSRALGDLIQEAGGRACMWRTGHSHIKARMRESGALLAGEFSGHICFADRWYGFDDAIYAAARFLELLSAADQSAETLFQALPLGLSTPEIKVETTEDRKFKIMEALANKGDFGTGRRTAIDGLRVDYKDGWGLVRASNTSPALTLRFEADGAAALDRIQGVFRTQLGLIDPNLSFNPAA